ncbi:MAG: LysR family transcriptional regulator [Sulfobacillus sp.]
MTLPELRLLEAAIAVAQDLNFSRAAERLHIDQSTVAVHLQSELKKIIEGKPPYDIFVRWKPLHEQPIGWEPDINDGVRLNVRPFMTAKALNGRGKGASILRVLPKGVKWDKDRGKEPHREKADFPWFWSWDGVTQDFTGGREFDCNRWNDLHYSIQAKKEARERQSKTQSQKGTKK